MKILWTTKGLGLGGAEQLGLQIARRLVAGGHELHLAYALSHLDDMAEDFREAGVVLHDLGGRRNLELGWVAALWRVVREQQPDVLHGHNPLTTAVGRVAAKVLSPRSRLVSTVHSVRELWKTPTRVAFELTSWADDWTFYVARRALETSPWQGESHELLYHGIDPGPARAELAAPSVTRAELGLRPDDFVVVMIATLRAEKRVELACQVLMDLVRSGVDHAHLLIIGGGVETPVAEEWASRSDGHIHVLGPQPRGFRFLAVADAMLLTSWTEGLPVSTMEAVHMGVPIVAPEVGGLPEIVDSAAVGTLCPEPHRQTLGRALRELAATTSPGTGRTPDARAVERWSVLSAADRYESVYRELLSGPRG